MSDDPDWAEAVKWDAFVDSNHGFDKRLLSLVQCTASRSRNGTPAVISRFTHGLYNVVFQVVFKDNLVWICRVHKNDQDVSPRCVESKTDSTVATMRYIKSKLPSFPIPEIYAFESDPNTSAIKAAYIFMEAMEGAVVGRLSPDDQCTVYKQLASIAWQLSGLCFSKIGRIYQVPATNEFYVGPFVDAQGNPYGPFEKSMEYLKCEARKIEAKHAQWRATYVESKKLLSEVFELYKRAASLSTDHDIGSFPLVHGDFDTHNALFRRDTGGKLQLTAIIDWDGAHTGSWLQFCTFPAFLNIRWPTFERGRYSQVVLDRIRRRQQVFLQQLEQEERTLKTCTPSRPTDLHTVFNSPAVTVAEFILIYSDPYYECDAEMIRKYLSAWRNDIDWYNTSS
jgi:Phosphotransferase enzyme family